MIEIQDWWHTLDGKSEAEAREICESNGFILRVESEDGEHLPCTADFKRNRFNVAINKGKVKAKPFKIG